MPDPFILIIPAAGSGQRMEARTPKPLLDVSGKRVLVRTLERFADIPGLQQVIIAASADLITPVQDMISNHFESLDCRVVQGGVSRQESVFKALSEVIDEDPLIVVHDAVRPFTDRRQILDCLDKASEVGAAILAVRVNDTIKEVGDDSMISGTVSRERLWRAQTPQVFRRDLLFRAHTTAHEKGYHGTDDASLVEWIGEPVAVVEGSETNIKLTYPMDLKMAELIVQLEQEGAS